MSSAVDEVISDGHEIAVPLSRRPGGSYREPTLAEYRSGICCRPQGWAPGAVDKRHDAS